MKDARIIKKRERNQLLFLKTILLNLKSRWTLLNRDWVSASNFEYTFKYLNKCITIKYIYILIEEKCFKYTS